MQASEEGLPRKTLSAEAMARLKAHRWPGNIRELENMVRRLTALYSHDVIGVDVIETEFSENNVSEAAPSAEPQSLSESIERHVREYFDAHEEDLPSNGLYDRILREMERPLLNVTLEATRGNQVKAAEVLGLNRNTLRKKIRDLGLEVVRGTK
eukprot:NODE_1851_length_1199_cov_1.315299_g1835_i0.p3 GENE.NODE_1851_length_1199_cov_1.315299_g1835_i0~~NODE_1851_length_1199_cov_1.315299_g1835_i0.p3  ORF type:complete len:154 (+),score=25.08 NODE_1851_length_1199_cov_1.315299_g1835_i0:177-638(+)